MFGSLRRQLLAGISVLFLLVLTGIETIHVRTARHILEEQLEASTQEAATSLGLSLGVLLTKGDLALAETVINPVFDRGYYRRIELISTDGKAMIDRRLPAIDLGVPDWFAALLPLDAPAASSLVTAGWKQIGAVRVTGHPRFAYRHLWHTAWGSLAWLAAWYVLAILAALIFLRRVLKPLDDIERVAVAIGQRDFDARAEVPPVRELRHVAEAINNLSVKVKLAIEAEGLRAESLRREAYQDTLTGLLNRRGFSNSFQARMSDAKDVFRGAFALLQLSDFEDYNREAGYAKGDALIEAIAAAVVSRGEPAHALSARWSGTAFVAVLPNAAPGEAAKFAENLSGAVAAALADAGCTEHPRFSIGMVTFEGVVPALTQLLSTADGAAAQADAQGIGMVNMEDAAAVEAIGSSAWRARLERAVAAGSFEIWIQPVLELPGRELMQREVIARLHDEMEQPVPAADFFPMAVRHGMAVAIDRLIVTRVMERLAHAPNDGEIAVNVSSVSAADDEFLSWIDARLLASPAVARRLVFELSESGSARDRDAVQAFARIVRRAGANFALDNFGLHPESIQIMRALLPAYVKLSRAHTAELTSDEASRFFVASLVRLGAPLDIRVIAQGVESEDVLPLLVNAGVAGFQGYFAAPPALWAD